MNKTIFNILTLLFAFMAMSLVGCSDDDAVQQTDNYGYVQFKLENSASVRAANGTLDNLSDASKIKVLLQCNGETIAQTLLLNYYNEENAHYYTRSAKLQLLVGTYNVIGFVLYDKLDRELLAADCTDTSFTIIGGGLESVSLTVAADSYGKATFRVMKNMTATVRATVEENDASFPLSSISSVDITIQNTFTLEKTTIKKILTDYVEDFNNDATPGYNSETSYLDCDTVVWLPAGTYKVYSFTAYSDKYAKKSLGTVYNTKTDDTFEILVNELSDNIEVPFDILGTKEYIKDYIALKEIWEALDGPNWKYYGETQAVGCNWYFNKDIDLWGDQPGVQLDSDGRVSVISLEGFGAKGNIPDAIGQLTEMSVLYLGSHSEEITDMFATDMTEEQRLKVRMDYKERFLEKDFRLCLSPEWQKTIELDENEPPLLKSVQKKNIQYGDYTNKITGISKAIMRCSSLEQFYIANSPIGDNGFFVDIDENSVYADEEASWSWDNLTKLTDIEIYNCPNLTKLPEMFYELPKLQMLNISALSGISGEQLRNDWISLINGKSGGEIQGIYMSYNNLEEFPEYDDLKKMVKLSLLDCAYNKIKKIHPFGKDISLTNIYLDYNEIEEVPNEDGYFCGYTQLETFNISYNKLTKFPDIFNARSLYVASSIDFSNNLISEFENGDNSRGVNVAQVDLSNNRLETFPSVLFKKNSPMSYLVLAGNGMTTIPDGAMQGDKAYYLSALDLSYNKLSELPDDFYAETLPYLSGLDISYNRFSEFPTKPLSITNLTRYFVRYQSDENGNRCLRDWPTGLYQHIGLRYFFIGGNDMRKIDDTISSSIYYFEIADNPNITIDVSDVCNYIYYGYYVLVYDKTQDIRGCDILDLEE